MRVFRYEVDEVGVLGVLGVLVADGPNSPKVGFGKGNRKGRCGGSGSRANTNVGVET